MEHVIEVYVRDDNGDVKIEPKSIKDLFSDFKPSSELENAEEETVPKEDEGEPESKQRKISKKDSDNVLPKKKLYLQKYRKEWENIPAYKPWLSESVLGNLYFYCKFCKNNNRCGRTEIDKHMICRKHKRNSKLPQHKVHRKFTFRGLLCSVFTPFTARDLDVRYDVIPEYASYLYTNGVKGILINDVAGEGMSLTMTERMKLTEEWAKACTKTKQYLMVQVGGAPLRQIQEMVKHAEKNKVSALVILPDLYNKPKDQYDLMRYIKLVSDVAPSIPLLYHHNPTYTGININMGQFLQDVLGEIDSFVGIIHSDDNFKNATSALQVNENKFLVFMGTDDCMLAAFASGFNSFVGVTLNFVPNLAQNILTAVENCELKEAREVQHLLKMMLETINRHGEWLPAMKAAMNLISPITVGPVRNPLVPIWQDKVNKMRLELTQLGIIPSMQLHQIEIKEEQTP